MLYLHYAHGVLVSLVEAHGEGSAAVACCGSVAAVHGLVAVYVSERHIVVAAAEGVETHAVDASDGRLAGVAVAGGVGGGHAEVRHHHEGQPVVVRVARMGDGERKEVVGEVAAVGEWQGEYVSLPFDGECHGVGHLAGVAGAAAVEAPYGLDAEARHQWGMGLVARRAVVVAGREYHQHVAPSCLAHLHEGFRQHRLGCRRGCGGVEDVAAHKQCVGMLFADDAGYVAEHLPLLGEAVPAHECLAYMPVGCVEYLHLVFIFRGLKITNYIRVE